MDNNYFFKAFEKDIQKMVRNYIFELDSLKGPDSFYFDKLYDYVKIYNYEETENYIIVTYQIYDKDTQKSKNIFPEPVEMKISKFHLLVTNFRYLNDKSGR